MITKKAFIVLLSLALVLSVGMLTGCEEAEEVIEEELEEEVVEEEPEEEVVEEEPEDVDIDIVVGFSAGGSNDLSARYMAEKFADYGINASVVNMPGGMGTEAAYHVSQQAPDSNMFMWAHPLILLFEPAAGDRGFTIHDFEPVALLASPTFCIGSKAGAPWDDMDDLVQYIEDNPGEVVLGGQGEGNMMHFIAELILDPDELDYTYVGLEGGADVASNLVGEHVDVGHLSLAAARPLHEDGDMTVLVNTQILVERDPLMPDIPNVIEFGIDAQEPHPLALWAPEGTDPELKERMSDAMSQMADDPELIENYQGAGMIAHYQDADETWDFFMDVEENMIPRFETWLEERR